MPKATAKVKKLPRQPLCRRRRYFLPADVQVERQLGERLQRHLIRLAPLAEHVQPAVTLGVELGLAEGCAEEFARAQAGRVRKVQFETEALCGAWRPSVRPLQSFGDDQDH